MPNEIRVRRAAARPESATPLGTRLAVDTDVGPRNRLEALERDLATRVRAHAVGPLLHPGERGVDVLDDLARRRGEQQIALALDVDGVALARLLVELRVA